MGPPGLEAREHFEAFQSARREVLRAQGLLVVVTAAAHKEPGLATGVDLARRRLHRAELQRDAALARLAAGRPGHEAFWDLPDDL